MSELKTNVLYYGDNLEILRKYIPPESIDLIYLDPPFNSQADYNVLFKEPTGELSEAQIRAFADTWHWDVTAERAFAEIVTSGPPDVVEMISALRQFLRDNDMMAYLVMMTIRLIELRRVLKRTGSIYLHCDPKASHYLKVVMDSVFFKHNFVNEIVWKRSDAHSDVGQGARHLGPLHDVLLFYSITADRRFNPVFTPLPESTVANWYRYVEEGTGRRYNKADLSGPRGRRRAIRTTSGTGTLVTGASAASGCKNCTTQGASYTRKAASHT